MSTNPTAGEVRAVSIADISRILVMRTGVDPTVLAGRDSTRLLDLQIDSLAALELQAAVAAEFGVELPEDTIELSVADVVAFVNARLATGGAPTGGAR